MSQLQKRARGDAAGKQTLGTQAPLRVEVTVIVVLEAERSRKIADWSRKVGSKVAEAVSAEILIDQAKRLLGIK